MLVPQLVAQLATWASCGTNICLVECMKTLKGVNLIGQLCSGRELDSKVVRM